MKPSSSTWFSAACAAAIVHRNYFFFCSNRINLLHLSEAHASNHCKAVFEAAKLCLVIIK